MGTGQAWLFLALGDAGGSSEWRGLELLLRAAFMVRQVLPSREELELSAAAWGGAGMLEARGSELRMTASGRAAFAAVVGSEGGLEARSAKLEALLAHAPAASPFTWSIEPATYLQATEAFRRWWTEISRNGPPPARSGG